MQYPDSITDIVKRAATTPENALRALDRLEDCQQCTEALPDGCINMSRREWVHALVGIRGYPPCKGWDP